MGLMGAQWLSGRVLDSRPRGSGFEPHRHHFVVSLSKNLNPSLVMVQLRKTCPFITERLLMGRKESNQIIWASNQETQKKPVFGVSDQVRPKPAYSATKTSNNIEIFVLSKTCSKQNFNIISSLCS